jgi:hypothetical protein
MNDWIWNYSFGLYLREQLPRDRQRSPLRIMSA